MSYASPRGSCTSLHLEYGELFSTNYLIDGLKLWGGIPPTSLRDFLESIRPFEISYPGCRFRQAECQAECQPQGCINSCDNRREYCITGRPCAFCKCRVAPFHESYIFPTIDFLNKHEIPRSYVLQEPGDLVIVNASVPHLVYNFFDSSAGMYLPIY